MPILYSIGMDRLLQSSVSGHKPERKWQEECGTHVTNSRNQTDKLRGELLHLIALALFGLRSDCLRQILRRTPSDSLLTRWQRQSCHRWRQTLRPSFLDISCLQERLG